MFKGRFLSADEAATVAGGDLGSLEPGLRERQRLWWWWHVWRRSRGRQELHSTSPGPCSTNFAFHHESASQNELTRTSIGIKTIFRIFYRLLQFITRADLVAVSFNHLSLLITHVNTQRHFEDIGVA